LKPCPQCKALSGIPIVYGYPSKYTLKKVRNGEIALGGCIVRSNPRWQCKNCGNRWGGKTETISANRRNLNSGSYNKRKQKPRQPKWEGIGSWETFQGSDKFEGHIPDWIKKRIRIYLGQVGEENLNKIKDPKKREKLILESKAYQGIKYVRDKHYLYKLDFSEGDETNSVSIYRKRRLSNRWKYVRTKSKV
jgi:hypothetical protein